MDELEVIQTHYSDKWLQLVVRYKSTRVEVAMLDARLREDGSLAMRREVFGGKTLSKVPVSYMIFSNIEREFLTLWLARASLTEYPQRKVEVLNETR